MQHNSLERNRKAEQNEPKNGGGMTLARKITVRNKMTQRF